MRGPHALQKLEEPRIGIMIIIQDIYKKEEGTLFCTMYPVSIGLRIPGKVAKVFDMPIKILAYCGAISK